MTKERVTIVLNIAKKHFSADIEVPLNITVNEFIVGLNSAYDIGIDVANVKDCYLKAENPMALLKGNRLLSEFGIHNGTIINITD